ncbi:MAG: methyltransferase domain-containing protein [Fuerstiella sp.]|nr:methyltransferase domain-containing protein [Fuerstiella sp.]MCP4856090.1 methyltransferase domain-containing protein [Fuerstiella sp.]
MFRAISNNLAFFRQFRQRFETTGAIAPSSRFLAKSMTRFLAKRGSEPVRVLEIGPGTGPVTQQIIPFLADGDQFDIVELNESFVDILSVRFQQDIEWQRAAPFSKIHQLPIQEYQPEQKYDFVISGLPLNNFPADLVESIADTYFKLLKPDGVLSYFEYMYVRPIRKVVTGGDEKVRITRIDDIMAAHCMNHRIARDNIILNIPPAWVQHLVGGREPRQATP